MFCNVSRLSSRGDHLPHVGCLGVPQVLPHPPDGDERDGPDQRDLQVWSVWRSAQVGHGYSSLYWLSLFRFKTDVSVSIIQAVCRWEWLQTDGNNPLPRPARDTSQHSGTLRFVRGGGQPHCALRLSRHLPGLCPHLVHQPQHGGQDGHHQPDHGQPLQPFDIRSRHWRTGERLQQGDRGDIRGSVFCGQTPVGSQRKVSER